MTQISPPVGPPHPGYLGGAPAPKQRMSGAAIASLVCGIVGCVPFVTSLAAVILGFIGIRKTRNPGVGGKGLAIAGLVLGLVGLVGWSLFCGTLLVAYMASQPARGVAKQFAIDLSNGNIPAATANSTGMTQQELTDVAEKIKAWGTVTDTTFPSFSARANLDGTTTCDLTGTAAFTSGGEKVYTVSLVKQNGTYKVTSFHFR